MRKCGCYNVLLFCTLFTVWRVVNAQSSSESLVQPLHPWLKNSSYVLSEKCVVIHAWNSGLGCMLNFLWWSLGIMKQINPEIEIYYNHDASRYQCSEHSSLTSFVTPKENILLLTDKHRPTAGCAEWDMMKPIKLTRHFFLEEWSTSPLVPALAGIFQAQLISPQLEHAAYQSRCQIVKQFWNLAPEVKQQNELTKKEYFGVNKSIIAIHIRSGDKTVEYMGDTDPNGHYRMDAGMHKLVHRYPNVLKHSLCVIIGDDEGYANSVGLLAKKILQCQYIRIKISSTQQGNTGHFQDNFNAMSLESRCNSSKNLFSDIDLMASADYFIGTPRSNLDHVVYGLRQCIYNKADNTAIDGGGRMHFGIWL